VLELAGGKGEGNIAAPARSQRAVRPVPRKLKTYQTSLGFFDMAVAAPSMKAALAAWGSKTNIFHQGFAKETSDPVIVAATMAKPGVVLRRPIGSKGAFSEHARLPKHLPLGEAVGGPGGEGEQQTKQPHDRTIGDDAARKAALAYDREQKRREGERRKEEAAREKERQRRDKAIAKAEAALQAATQVHDASVQRLADERAALDLRSQAEDARWEKEKARLEAAMHRARQ
jgi:hypothetical protein